MLDEMRQLYCDARHIHKTIYTALQQFKTILDAQSNEELADCTYALRESAKLLDDVRKECDAIKKRCEKTAAMRELRDNLASDGNIYTEYVTASIEMKICASAPTFDKNPEQYAEIMTYLGIDPMLWDQGTFLTEEGEIDTEVVKVNWNGFRDFLTRLKKNGYPLPPGIDSEKTFTEYYLICRKRKGILEDNE